MKKTVWLLIPLSLLLASNVLAHVHANYGRILYNKAASGDMSAASRANYMRQAIEHCSPELADLNATDMSTAALEEIGGCYATLSTPTVVLQEQTDVPAAMLDLAYGSKSNQLTGDYLSMYGNGIAELRIATLAVGAELWDIALTAQHDDPPPVRYELWLDQTHLGDLDFDKGDKSWGTEVLSVSIAPGFHRLEIRYTNDLVDRDQDLDRNAYLQNVTFTKQGD